MVEYEEPDTKEVEVDPMTPDQGLEVILTVVAAGLGHDPALEVMEDNRIHAHTPDLIHDPEVALLLSQEDRDPHLFWTSVELQVLENDRSHIKEKQDFIMKIALRARLAAGAPEVIGVEAAVEVEAGHDPIQDLQDLHQDPDLVRKAHTKVRIEVEAGWTCARKDGHQEVEVDHLVLDLIIIRQLEC